jgi:hypothetical protein
MADAVVARKACTNSFHAGLPGTRTSGSSRLGRVAPA